MTIDTCRRMDAHLKWRTTRDDIMRHSWKGIATLKIQRSMSEAVIEKNIIGGRAIDILLRILWRCGTFASGVVALAMGILYVKVNSVYQYFIRHYFKRRIAYPPSLNEIFLSIK